MAIFFKNIICNNPTLLSFTKAAVTSEMKLLELFPCQGHRYWIASAYTQICRLWGTWGA